MIIKEPTLHDKDGIWYRIVTSAPRKLDCSHTRPVSDDFGSYHFDTQAPKPNRQLRLVEVLGEEHSQEQRKRYEEQLYTTLSLAEFFLNIKSYADYYEVNEACSYYWRWTFDFSEVAAFERLEAVVHLQEVLDEVAKEENTSLYTPDGGLTYKFVHCGDWATYNRLKMKIGIAHHVAKIMEKTGIGPEAALGILQG